MTVDFAFFNSNAKRNNKELKLNCQIACRCVKSGKCNTFVNLNADDDDGLFYIFTPDENGRSQLDAIVD